MHAVLLSLLLFASLQVWGQKGVKLSVVDGDSSYHTTEKKIYAQPGSRNAVGDILKSTFYRYKTGYSLSFFVQTGRTSHFSINRGAEAQLIWADGNSISINCRNGSQSRPSRLDYGGFLYIFYSVSASQLKTLSEKPISSIRINSSTGWMEYSLTEKNARLLMEQAKVIL